MVKLPSLKPLIIERFGPNGMVCFAKGFLDHKRIGNVRAVNTKKFDLRGLNANGVESKLLVLKFDESEWDTSNWPLQLPIFGFLKGFRAD
jgi:hypothetical protein